MNYRNLGSTAGNMRTLRTTLENLKNDCNGELLVLDNSESCWTSVTEYIQKTIDMIKEKSDDLGDDCVKKMKPVEEHFSS